MRKGKESYEDFCTYEQSKALKKLGFDWECNHWYHPLEDKILESVDYSNHNRFERPYSAPTLSQAQKWIYEKFGIWVEPAWNVIEDGFVWIARWIKPFYNAYNDEASRLRFETPTEALSSGIDRVLEILKEN